MIVADTSGLLAFFNRREPAHDSVKRYIDDAADVIVVSPFVIAELDYLVLTRLGADAAVAVGRELASGAYELASIDAAALQACADVADRYRDQPIGLADASLVVLADRYATTRVLTLDRRHFDVLRPLSGGRFSIVGT